MIFININNTIAIYTIGGSLSLNGCHLPASSTPCLHLRSMLCPKTDCEEIYLEDSPAIIMSEADPPALIFRRFFEVLSP